MVFQNSRARAPVLAALFFLPLVLLGCGSEETSTPKGTPAASPTTATATPAPMPTTAVAPEAGLAEIGVRYQHVLYTHCGIRDTIFDGQRWLADPVLRLIGGPNPPYNWNNPYDPGTMELVAKDRALFISDSGERAYFIRPPEGYQFKPCI